MSRTIVRLTSLLFVAVFSLASQVEAAEDGFHSLFDGKTLKGWSAPDMRFWSVRDGAITAESSDALPCKKNQFLVWQRGDLDNFDLRLKFRILGTKNANSGIQIRSQIAADGHATGYQADIDRSGQWLGALYDEHTGRRGLAKRGQSTAIDAAGKRESKALDLSALKVDLDAWNDYHIVARGTRLELRINGTLTAEVDDRETKHRDLFGKLALQIHSGPAMTVQFKDIRLKRLPLEDGQKKIVLIAGAPSHGCGAHEFNAGIKILAKRLRKVEGVVVANYHDNGWPKDPSAFDNANAVVIYADGQGRHPVQKNYKFMDGLMKKGVGLMCMHYAVHVQPGSEGSLFQDWIGGFYESNYSSNPHWDAHLKLNQKHPITNGIQAASIHDEWYFCIRFREKMKDVHTILEAKPT
ncbi:MAG: DUF1080 domain-containing protein, partial [Planctomycetota bacterium]